MNEKQQAIEKNLIILRRIALRHQLEACFLPSTVACCVAWRWPTLLFPAVLYYRLKRYSERT